LGTHGTQGTQVRTVHKVHRYTTTQVHRHAHSMQGHFWDSALILAISNVVQGTRGNHSFVLGEYPNQ